MGASVGEGVADMSESMSQKISGDSVLLMSFDSEEYVPEAVGSKRYRL